MFPRLNWKAEKFFQLHHPAMLLLARRQLVVRVSPEKLPPLSATNPAQFADVCR